MSNIRQNFITLILILMISIVPNLAKTNYHKKMCDDGRNHNAKIVGGHATKRRNFYSTYQHISFIKCVFAFLCLKSFMYFSFDFLSNFGNFSKFFYTLQFQLKKDLPKSLSLWKILFQPKSNFFKKQNYLSSYLLTCIKYTGLFLLSRLIPCIEEMGLAL